MWVTWRAGHNTHHRPQRLCFLLVLSPSPGSSEAASLPVASPPPPCSTNVFIYSASAHVPGPTIGPGDSETKLAYGPCPQDVHWGHPQMSLWSQAWSMKSCNLTLSHVARPDLSLHLPKVRLICCNIIFVCQLKSEKMHWE